jgi:two-component system chemotaxis response regulator CheY
MRKLEKVEDARVLVIDDAPLVRMLLRKSLARFGVQDVRESPDGIAGLAETASFLPDLVFCDIHMPEMDGTGYLERVRNFTIEAIRQTPIVFLTSDRREDMIVLAKNLRVDGYIVKPPAMQPLHSALERSLKVFVPRLS